MADARALECRIGELRATVTRRGDGTFWLTDGVRPAVRVGVAPALVPVGRPLTYLAVAGLHPCGAAAASVITCAEAACAAAAIDAVGWIVLVDRDAIGRVRSARILGADERVLAEVALRPPLPERPEPGDGDGWSAYAG